MKIITKQVASTNKPGWFMSAKWYNVFTFRTHLFWYLLMCHLNFVTPRQVPRLFMFSGMHSGYDDNYWLLGCDAIQFGS